MSPSSSSPPPPERPPEFVQSLERGLTIIGAFGPDAPTQTVGELAGRTGLTRATARRFLITLSTLGYVDSDGREYWLTPKVLELGYSFLSGLRFVDLALPHMERLVARFDEDSEAAVLTDRDIVYVARVPSSKMMTAPMNVGGRMPAHATALGKVLLAYLSEAELDAYLASVELLSVMPNTVTDPGLLRAQLREIRAQGYALADQELEVGLIALGAPVRDRRGAVVGAINVSTNVLRWPADALMSTLKEPLLQTARLIERDLASTS